MKDGGTPPRPSRPSARHRRGPLSVPQGCGRAGVSIEDGRMGARTDAWGPVLTYRRETLHTWSARRRRGAHGNALRLLRTRRFGGLPPHAKKATQHLAALLRQQAAFDPGLMIQLRDGGHIDDAM